MSDNLVSLFNKLSYHIVTKQLNEEQHYSLRKNDERFFNECLRRVRQKGCDILLKKTTAPPLHDPCITDYGGNWSPITLLTDYAKELESNSNSKCNDILMNSIKCLQENDYDCVNEILKFLLMLKKPFVESQMQNSVISVSRSDFFQNSIDSFTDSLGEPILCLNNDLSRHSSFKKALRYEESWTKAFDSKFQVLGEYSKKNLLVPDKVSFDSLFTAKPTIASQSQSNSFVFTDFCIDKNYQSEKSIFDHNRNSYLSDVPMLDSFVDTPISHKLPNLLNNQKEVLRSSHLLKSCDQMKRTLHLLKEEELLTAGITSQECINKESDSSEFDEQAMAKASGIELKRNSNCSHSFNILYEKNPNFKSEEPSISSYDSLLLLRDTRRKRMDKNSSTKYSSINSKEIVLGLWEHDKSILKELCPDLVGSLPSLRMISTVDFVEDVKYLLTGINSGSFQFDAEENCFTMKYGTCLSDVTPESLFHFSKEFLETGSYYVKLSKCAIENGKTNIETCTTISQAFWRSIFDYLELHYSMVISIPETTNLMVLKSSIKDIHDMMVTISNICKISESSTLPESGQLLTYLLQNVEKINRATAKNIVFGIFQNCCSVYFKCILQPWLFRGYLEKQCYEFFIDCNRQKTNMKTRNYYNSFFIDNDKIPCFLVGLEESIFNCGKSIHFLKLFNMEDRFCQILEKSNYPAMRLCLSDDELEKLEKRFKEYGNMVVENCGKGVSIKDIKREEMEKEKLYLDFVRDFKSIQESEREAVKSRELKKIIWKRETQNKLLNDELNRMQAEKEKKKREDEEATKKMEEIINRDAEMEKNAIELEKVSMKKYYGELSKALDEKLHSIEERKKNVVRLLSNTSIETNPEDEEIFLDVINDNNIIERETTNSVKSRETALNLESIDVNSNPIRIDDGETIVQGGLTSVKTRTIDTPQTAVTTDENCNVNSTSELAVTTRGKRNETVDNNKNNNNGLIGTKSSNENVAFNEAKRNKMKALRLEFGIDLDEMSQSRFQSEPSRNRIEKETKFQSEHDIFKSGSDSILVKSVTSQTEIAKEIKNANGGNLESADSTCLKEAFNFREVELERKKECIDLENNLDVKTSNSDSLNSFATRYSEGNVSVSCDSEREIIAVAAATSQSIDNTVSGLSLINNRQYQNALLRDSEISNHKLEYRDVFQSMIQIESAKAPSIDLMRFQRCLRKSALIPVVAQEKLANDALLRHLIIGENLLSHLKSLRGFFFLNDGEFGRSFIHNTFRSLARCGEPQEFFERSNLSNIVNEALNYTIHGSEPNSQNLSFKIVNMPPFLNHSSHDVLSPFELTYKVDWPLNIILTEKALSKYKSVFRYLLKLKRIVWTLNENAFHLNCYFKNRKINRTALLKSSHYHKIQIYRHAMTQVIITLDDYIFTNGIQLPWVNFLKDLETASNIDHLYQKHVRYIKEVVLRCFLTKSSKEFLNHIHSVIELTLKFHYTTVSAAMTIVGEKYEHPKFQVLRETFNEFCSVIKVFLRTLKEKIATNQAIKSHYVLVEKFDLKLS